MHRIKSVDMLHGNLLGLIIKYTIPIIFIGLIQSLFNAVDIMVLGYVADTNAVASVGATTSIVHLLVNTFFGISTGAKIVLARLLGSGEGERVKKTVSTSMLLALALGVIVAVAGYFLSPIFLTLTDCPQECFDGALIYMRLYLVASPVIMLYNFGTAILSVSGDSQRPLYYMLASGGVNVVLNFVLCFIMEEKVAAVAIATAVSQMLGALLVIIRLTRMSGLCRLDLRHLSWSNVAFRKVMSNGIPIGLSSALYPIANLQIQAAVNSFGPAVIAGNSAMSSIEGVVSNIAAAPWGATTGVFVGQNIGADNKKRVRGTIFYCLGISAALGVILGVLGTVFSHPLVSLYVSDEAAIEAAQVRMMYTLLPHAIAAINGILAQTVQAFGYSMLSTVNSIFSVLVFRAIWMQFVYPTQPTFDMLCRCYFVSWLLVLTVNIVFVLYLYNSKFKKGNIKKM